ncbi:hypothetical protein V6N12_055883 [Hibiscus sabdariffa]|uniref:Uncharacterized protein n=1 Tax=Hibiscus sabdariffa TaxID=183260 RepID=A0ABR2CRC8_9ROSI
MNREKTKREKAPAAKFGGDFGGVATLLTCTFACSLCFLLSYAGRPLFLFLWFLARFPTPALTYIYKILLGLISSYCSCFCFGVNWVQLELSKVFHLF